MGKVNTVGNNVDIVSAEVVLQLGGSVARNCCQAKIVLMIDQGFQKT
jgi:hypothetical protein